MQAPADSSVDLPSLNGAAASNGALAHTPEPAAAQQQLEASQAAQALPSVSAHRKDANDVLMLDGPEALRRLVDNAEIYPVDGLFE